MGKPPLEIVAYSSALFFPFRLKQNKPMSAKSVAERERADQAKKKVVGAVTKKRSGPPTIDDRRSTHGHPQ